MLLLKRFRRALAGALVVVGCLLVAAGPAAAAAQKKHRPTTRTPASVKKKAPVPVSQAPVAAKLVSRALAAHTPAAQSRAMLAMMKALHIGVVIPAGKPVSVGVDAGAASLFQLYTVELGPLGASLTRAPSLTLDDVAASLARSGITLGSDGRALPAGLVRDGLVAAVKDAARNPRTGAALLPLIVRQLGLREHPAYDLAHAPAASQIHLTGLQAWLIGADMQLSVLRHIPLSTAAHAATVVTAAAQGGPAARQASALTDVCQKYNDASDALDKKLEKLYGGTTQKWIGGLGVGLVGDGIKKLLGKQLEAYGEKNLPSWAVTGAKEYIENVSDGASLITKILEGIHGSLLALSISVHTQGNVSDLPPVHWYHTPGEAGHQLTFAVVVEMLDDYGDVAVKCGSMVGFTFPPKGGIAGVPILWEQAQGTLTPDMGSLNCTYAALGQCASLTDASGVARITFTPKTEPVPGLGLQQETTGVMNGIAAYQTGASGSLLGQIAQVLVPKYAGVRWHVTYHVEPKLFLQITETDDHTYTNQTESQFESTGTGTMHFVLGSNTPLTRVTATDGTNVWTGSSPVTWNAYTYHDDNKHFGAASDCDGGNSTLSIDGTDASPGQLSVDSLTYDPTKGAAGLSVTFHTSQFPTYTRTETFTADKTVQDPCRDSTTTSTGAWDFPSDIYALGTGVNSSGTIGNTSGPTYTVTGWTPGPGMSSGSGVIASRTYTRSGTGAYGEPDSQSLTLSIVAAQP